MYQFVSFQLMEGGAAGPPGLDVPVAVLVNNRKQEHAAALQPVDRDHVRAHLQLAIHHMDPAKVAKVGNSCFIRKSVNI